MVQFARSIGLADEICSVDRISMTLKYTGVIHQSLKCASFHKRPDLSSSIASSGRIRHPPAASVPLNRFHFHNSTSILPNSSSYCDLSPDTAASESGHRHSRTILTSLRHPLKHDVERTSMDEGIQIDSSDEQYSKAEAPILGRFDRQRRKLLAAAEPVLANCLN
jgi:hypothetical protein